MVRIVRQFALWHPERQILMQFTNSETEDGIWAHLPEASAWEPWQVKQTYEQMGWKVVSALVSIQEEGS